MYINNNTFYVIRKAGLSCLVGWGKGRVRFQILFPAIAALCQTAWTWCWSLVQYTTESVTAHCGHCWCRMMTDHPSTQHHTRSATLLTPLIVTVCGQALTTRRLIIIRTRHASPSVLNISVYHHTHSTSDLISQLLSDVYVTAGSGSPIYLVC